MAARYSHLSAQYLADAVKGLDKIFDEKAVSGTSSPQSVPAPLALIEGKTVNA